MNILGESLFWNFFRKEFRKINFIMMRNLLSLIYITKTYQTGKLALYFVTFSHVCISFEVDRKRYLLFVPI